MNGRSIKIFLIDGTSTGLRTAEIGMSTIKALVIPRASIPNMVKRPEPQKTGVYILVDPDTDQPDQKMIYIGEGDTIINRLNAHDRDESRDFWEEAILFVSKDENLTKSHIRYLEARLIALAKQAKRATVTNATAPSQQGKIPEADEFEMEEFIVQARLLLGTLGYDLFEPSILLQSVATNEIEFKPQIEQSYPAFRYSGGGFSAECIIDVNAGKYIVKVGSLARKYEAVAIPKSVKRLREQLIENGVLVDHSPSSFRFSQDYSFSSPSSAAQVVAGFSVGGRTAWMNGNKTYADWQENQILKESAGLDDLPNKSLDNDSLELDLSIIQKKNEVILEVGCEGGSLTLFGERNSTGDWRFLSEKDEATVCQMLLDEDREGLIDHENSGYFNSFEEALKLFNRYPWVELYPLKVHPDFLDQVLLEVEKCGGKSESLRWQKELNRWAKNSTDE